MPKAVAVDDTVLEDEPPRAAWAQWVVDNPKTTGVVALLATAVAGYVVLKLGE